MMPKFDINKSIEQVGWFKTLILLLVVVALILILTIILYFIAKLHLLG